MPHALRFPVRMVVRGRSSRLGKAIPRPELVAYVSQMLMTSVVEVPTMDVHARTTLPSSPCALSPPR